MTEKTEDRNLSALGIDLGGPKTALIAGDTAGRVFERVEFPTFPENGYASWLVRLRENYQRLLSLANMWKPKAAGISVGGPADWQRGVLLDPPNLPGWRDAAVREDAAGICGVPCRMEHDGRACALAEHRFGAGRGCSNIVFLTFGTGIGAGLILEGRLYRGAAGASGEVGHVRIRPDGPVAYGKPGCLESFASGAGIARLAAHRYPNAWDENASAKDVIDKAGSGDPNAQAVLDESAESLGLGLAVLIDILNPEMIVLGSLADRVGTRYLEKAIRMAESESLSGNFRACRIVPSELKDRLQDVAALMAATEGL